MKRLPALFAVVALALTATAQAQAASSTCQAYNPQLCAVSTTVSTVPSASASELPFTGLDLLLLGVGGGGLIAVGLFVRRLTTVLDPVGRAAAIDDLEVRRGDSRHGQPQTAGGR